MYTPKYFIDKFSKIPESRWITHNIARPIPKRILGIVVGTQMGHCALGHAGWKCAPDGTQLSKEADALGDLFVIFLRRSVVGVNDYRLYPYTQRTPKKRILAALADIDKEYQSQDETDSAVQIAQEIINMPIPEVPILEEL